MREQHELYEAVAADFAAKVQASFLSEDSLAALWAKHVPGLTFDRTTQWNTILLRELNASWAEHGPEVKGWLTAADRALTCSHLARLLDPNLFTQVLLNLQRWDLIRYRAGEAAAARQQLVAAWTTGLGSGKGDPFAPKARMTKMKTAEWDPHFNNVLSKTKALNIIASASPFVSFRVSPKGTTPAFADSSNLSTMGIGGDEYLRPPEGYQAYYFTWESVPDVLIPTASGSFSAPGIPYEFKSKSGGDKLNDVLAIRLLMTRLMLQEGDQEGDQYGADNLIFLPRMTSLLAISTWTQSRMEQRLAAAREMVSSGWFIDLHSGTRNF